MKRTATNPILVCFVLVFMACNANPKQQSLDDNPKESATKSESQPITENKSPRQVLFFEQKFGNGANQKASYELTFEGDKVEMKYQYADNKPMLETANFRNGKIMTSDCSDCYTLQNDGFCVSNPETGIPDCYFYIKEKSSSSIEKVLNNGADLNSSTDNIILSLKEVQLTLLDAGEQKMNLYLGKPDYSEMLMYGAGAVAVYVNRINENGSIKDLAVGFKNGKIVSVQALITKYHRTEKTLLAD